MIVSILAHRSNPSPSFTRHIKKIIPTRTRCLSTTLPKTRLPTLSSLTQRGLDNLLKSTTSRNKLPAVLIGVTNAKETIYVNQSGLKVFGDIKSGQIDNQTTLQLFSMSKLVTCVAALTLVDQDILQLDSPSLIKRYCPELNNLPILTGFDGEQPVYKPADNQITLRMLMNHSAGLSYPDHPLLLKYHTLHPIPPPLTSKTTIESFLSPLVYTPGTSYTYSTSIDWVGILISRITGLSLEEYIQQRVFSKIKGGMPDTTFYPRQDIKDRLLRCCHRDKGALKVVLGSLTPGIERESDPRKISNTLSGGSGLFGTTNDYLSLLRAILSSNPKYQSSNPLLSPSSYQELIKGSLNKAGRQALSEMVGYDNVDHSVGFCLSLEDSEGGRKAGSGSWGGLAKTEFWIDPKAGITAVCNTQLISEDPDEDWLLLTNTFEKEVYKGLK